MKPGRYIVRWTRLSPSMFAEFDGTKWDFYGGDVRYGTPHSATPNPMKITGGQS